MSNYKQTGTCVSTLQLLIVDDHPFYRRSLCQMCEVEGGFTILGEASNGLDAISMVSVMQPDVVLMDMEMPGVDGLTATRQLLTRSPCPPIILLTTYYSLDERRQAEDAGARGYLAKDTSGRTLIEAIHEVFSGRSWFRPPVE